MEQVGCGSCGSIADLSIVLYAMASFGLFAFIRFMKQFFN